MFNLNSAQSSAPLNSERRSQEASRHILVVEDDIDLCMLIQQVVQGMDENVHVQFASTVHEAAMWLDGSPGFDLVLSDFLLADSRSGYELRKICQERVPDAQFVMMSAMPLNLPDLAENEFLQKPFSPTECAAFIEDAFENASA
ncbi:MAG: response regulator [Myxococcota bacterium]